MMSFLCGLVVVIAGILFGARFHTRINERLNRLFNKSDQLPPDFEYWLSQQPKGQYGTIGDAMGAWADARFGNQYDNLLH